MNEDTSNDFALTTDGRWLVTTGIDQTVLSDVRTGTPVAPPLPGRPAINLRVAIPPDGRRAIVSGFSNEIVGYDLAALLVPSGDAAERLLRHAEVVACQRVHENGELVQLTPAEWLERWNSLESHP